MSTPMNAWKPSDEDLASYVRGALPTVRFTQVDNWLAQQDEDMVAALLELANGRQAPSYASTSDSDSGTYKSSGRHRFTIAENIASGGMGSIDSVYDGILDRDVVLKRCHPRAPDEPVETHLERQHLFRLEALLTARLEHPSIIPVHDFGQDEFGEPSMVLKKLNGQDLMLYAKEHRKNANWSITEGVDIAIRVCEAMAYAHAAGVVHRDLKPDNLIIGEYGAVTVIDWGLAAAIKPAPELSTDQGDHPTAAPVAPVTHFYGTPAWMAPEQARGTPADPRMDVWALGGILAFMFTGKDPRKLPKQCSRTTLVETIRNTPPNDRRYFEAMPPSLRAVAQRCLDRNPEHRYPHAGAVLAELRRWLSDGITEAQNPGPVRRGMALIRRYRGPVIVALTSILLIGAFALSQVLHHRYHTAFAEETAARLLSQTPVLDLDAVETALVQLDAMREQYGDLPAITAAHGHFTSVANDLREQIALEDLEARLTAIETDTRIRGPQASQIATRMALLNDAGIDWENPSAHTNLSEHPLSDELLANLAALEGLLLLHDRNHDEHRHQQHEQIRDLFRSASSSPPWTSLASILEAAHVQPHDLHLPNTIDDDLSAALAHPVVADVLLPITAPDARLLVYATKRLNDNIGANIGAFWPHMLLARSYLVDGRLSQAERHALIALGTEPDSSLPKLLLAYVALERSDTVGFQQYFESLKNETNESVEILILNAAFLAKNGKTVAAQDAIDAGNPWDHLRLHSHVHAPHPMDRSIAVLKAAGVRLTPP
ncbi:MAG: serine/threonine-protein kinase [Planctomycetota bacterium]|jgi:tRNA A-37 threonylcarbamoyl transferase component Bud32|nr:serine/threonine-protein kinase [Planctomycetota bacterium]